MAVGTLCTAVAVVLSVMVSCDEVVIEDDETLFEGNLRVTVFQIERTPFATLTRAAVPAAEACTRLNFAVYTPDGTRVKQVNQTSDMANYGAASFQLDEGDYLLVVVGHSSGGNPTMSDPTSVRFTNAQGYTDTFLCTANITVGEDAVDYQATLERITALCRFVLTDSYPAGVAKMRFYYTGGSGAFNALTGYGCVNSKQELKCDVSASQKQFDLYTYLHDSEGTIHLTVTALDGSGGEVAQREFDVPMQQNCITWLSGAFFGGGGGGSGNTGLTSITVNTAWAGETHLTF